MKITWARIKDAVYILSLIGIIITWRVDKARDKAIMETQMAQFSEIQSEIKSKLDTKFYQYDQYWIQNAKNITRIVTVLELDAD